MDKDNALSSIRNMGTQPYFENSLHSPAGRLPIPFCGNHVFNMA